MIESIFLYSIRSAFVLTLLYVPYMLILRKESFFRLNRAVLLLILLFSVVLPMLDVHFLSLDSQPVVQDAKGQMVQVGIPLEGYHLLPELSVQARHVPTEVSWFHIVSVLFSFVAMAMLLWRIMQILRMNLVVTRGNLWHEVEGGIHIHCHAGEVSPFSWMNHVVISDRDFCENGREILLHETGHIRALHSWDLLLLSAVQVLQWWNPLAYVFASSLRDVHEYEADDYVLQHGISARSYQLLLIKKAVGASSYTFANNFDHSLTLKRITMMQKSKSSVWMRSKVLYIIPMATLALSAFATSESVSPSGNDVARNKDKVIKISATGQAEGTKKSDSSAIFPTDENTVCLVDGKEASQETAKALSPEKIEAITVFKKEAAASLGYPGKTVIKIKTKKVVEQVKFLPDEAVLSSYDTPQKVSYVPKPAVQAQFKGGDAALMQWLSKNVKYPSEAQNQGVMGRVIMELFITEKGEVTNVRAIAFGKHAPEGSKSLPEVVVMAYANEKKTEGKELSAQEKEAYKRAVEAMLAESVRVISAMPAWEPGYVDKDKKQPCTTRMVLPIVFRLG
ncbi:MAG: hypothetical protein IKW22_00920 [Bacteroidaceae bacterium]|nr:hypothetical protein [Bacteroidaceae bacterium]